MEAPRESMIPRGKVTSHWGQELMREGHVAKLKCQEMLLRIVFACPSPPHQVIAFALNVFAGWQLSHLISQPNSLKQLLDCLKTELTAGLPNESIKFHFYP